MYHGVKLYRCYNVKELVGKAGKNGRFKTGRKSDLYYELCALYDQQKLRPDRLSFAPLKRVTLNAEVRTVEKDYRQRDQASFNRYSVIGRLIDVDSGSLQ